MKKGIIILALVFFLSAIAVNATEIGLDVESVKVNIDDMEGSSTKTLQAGGGTTFSVTPNASLKFTIKFKNMFESETENDYEDVSYTVTISDIDDGDDIEEESDTFDLEAERSTSKSVEMDIPLRVEEDRYDVDVEIEGYLNGSERHTLSLQYTLDLKKESHKVFFTDFYVMPEKVECGGSAEMITKLMNLGMNEEDIITTVVSSPLSISFKDEYKLSEDIDDDDNEISRSYFLRIPADTKAGTYPISVRASYNKDRDAVLENFNLKVECAQQTSTTTTTGGNVTTEVDTGSSTTTGNVVAQPTQQYMQPIPVVKKGMMDQWILVIILAELILVVLGVIVLVALKKK